MKREIIGFILTAAITAVSVNASASDAIPDHCGTSMAGIEIGTQPINSSVLKYSEIFQRAGDQYGVDPNLLAAICMQESAGQNLSFRSDGSEYPAWGIMQIEYTLEKSFAQFGLRTTGAAWTLQDRLNEEKSIMFAASLISDSLIKYDCDYLKMIQAYNFSSAVLDKIIEANGSNWINALPYAASYAEGWQNNTYGDAHYIQHVLRYYHNNMPYRGAKVRINETLTRFEDQYPLIIDDYTFIPVRGVFEKLGAQVLWDGGARTVTLTRNGTQISLTLGSDTARVNSQSCPLGASARLINGRTMIPLRFISEELGFAVEWNSDTRTAVIYG